MIFGNGRTQSSLVFENLRQSLRIFGSLRKSSAIIQIVLTWPKTQLDILKKLILAFLEPFLLLSGKKKCCFKESFTVSIKMPIKFYCFMLQSQKIKCLVLTRYIPHFRPPRDLIL